MRAAFVLVIVGAFVAGFAGRRLDVGGADASSTEAVETLGRRVAAMGSERESVAAASSRVEVESTDETPPAPDHRLEALESRVAAAMKQATDDAAAAAAASDEADVDSELRRLRGLATPALFEEIRAFDGERWSSNEAWKAGLATSVAACDCLLARAIDAPLRSRVLTIQGTRCRSAGDFVRAESTMREALGLVSPTSEEGVGAAMQLAFNLSFQHDCRGAAERFLAIAMLPGLSASYRAQCRYRAGNFLSADAATARPHFQAVVDEFGASDDKHARYWADESRKAIGQLERGVDAR